MAKKHKNLPAPKVAKVKVTGKLDSLTDFIKLNLFEYSPQKADHLVKKAQKDLLTDQAINKVQKNVNRCLTKNPCFRSEGKGLWCLRLDGLKENDAAHRILQAEGGALRVDEINKELKELGKPEIAGERKLVSDGRFLRLKDGRWGLIHWAYLEPEINIKGNTAKEASTTAKSSSKAKENKTNKINSSIESDSSFQLLPLRTNNNKKSETLLKSYLKPILPLANDKKESDFWDKLLPLKKSTPLSISPNELKSKSSNNKNLSAWEEVAASAEAAILSIETDKKGKSSKEFSLIAGGKVDHSGNLDIQKGNKLATQIEDLRKENKNLLSDLEKLHRRKEELRQELNLAEEQLVNLRVDRDTLKKRVSHLETRLMQLQGTLNKTVSDAQAEQSRLKQQLREQEYRLQTTIIANEDLERTVAELQKERQNLKRQLSIWPVRLALRFASFIGFSFPQERPRPKVSER
ncbi:MAG: hypothetical protein PWP31_672 [Clostridia bacterium]|nr:hypothetical protein [Clostridia bacterium]